MACGERGPDGERCHWAAGHGVALISPGTARDGLAREVEHSWALPPLWPRSLRLGTVEFIAQSENEPTGAPGPE